MSTIDPAVWQEAISVLRLNLRNREGYSLIRYPDHRGNDTIGIGHLMLPDDPEKMTDEQVMETLAKDISIVIQDFNTLFHGVLIDNPVRLAAVLEWLFIMGLTNARDFHETIDAIKKRDWLQAAVDLLKNHDEKNRTSRWFGDDKTEERAFRIADAICFGRN